MIPLRLVRHSVRTVTRYRLRSAFMMLGSLLGGAALMLVLAVGGAVERKMLATARQLFGGSSIMVMAGGTALMSGPRPGSARLTVDDLAAVAAEVPEIGAWEPQQAMPSAAVKRQGASTTARVLGDTERYGEVWDRGVSAGRFFDSVAVRSAARVAVLGRTAADALFGSEEPIGGEIHIGGVPFEVIGVLERFGTDLHGMDRDNEIVVPVTTLQRRLLNVDTIAMAKLLVRHPDAVAATSSAVRRVLRQRHGLASGRGDDFRLISAVAVERMVGKVQRTLRMYLPAVAGLVLLVGGIVAASLTMAAVHQRVGEIGLRRAVGARTGDITSQFLVETAATGVAGALLGVVVGAVLAGWVASRMHLAGVAFVEAAGLTLIVALLVCLLAGVLPARRAARLDPAAALR